MDVNGGFYPNSSGNPVFVGTTWTGPLLAGNIIHTDGSTTLAGLGGTSAGLANVGFAQMAQSAVVAATATSVTTSIVLPAQSQITDIYFMVTTVQSGATIGIGTTANATGLTPATSGSLTTAGQLNASLLPSTALQIANWDNVSNATAQPSGPQDVQVTVTFSATGAGVGTLTVFYIQAINNAS